MAETKSPDGLPHWRPSSGALCARCQENPVGPGGIICPGCRTAIEAANRALAKGDRDDDLY